MDAEHEYVRSEEAADILGVPLSRIDVMLEQGLLHPVEIETEIGFQRAEVEALRLQGA